MSDKPLHIRIAVLEDAILTHRRMVRDGWVPRWKPDLDPNLNLWGTLGDDGV